MAESTATPTKRRGCGCFTCVLAAPLGCLAFFVGAFVVLIALVPWWLSGELESGLEKEFNLGREGRFDIDSVDMAWFNEQGIQNAVVRDPDGAEVLRFSLEVPPLYDCLSTWMESEDVWNLGEAHARLWVDLVVDENGVSNLDRAIAARGWQPARLAVPPAPGTDVDRRVVLDVDPGDGRSIVWGDGYDQEFEEDLREIAEFFDQLERMPLAGRLHFEIERLSYRRAGSEFEENPFVLRGLRGTLQATEEDGLVWNARGATQWREEGEVSWRVGLHPWAPPPTAEPSRIELTFDLSAFPVGILEAWTGEPRWRDAFGDQLTLSLQAPAIGPDGGNVTGKLESSVVQASLEGELGLENPLDPRRWLAGDVLRGGRFDLHVEGVDPAWFAEDLPEGLSLAWPEESPLHFQIEELKSGGAASGVGGEPVPWFDRLEFATRFELANLAVAKADPAAPEKAPQTLLLEKPWVSLRRPGGSESLHLDLVSEVPTPDGTPGTGRLEVKLTTAWPLKHQEALPPLVVEAEPPPTPQTSPGPPVPSVAQGEFPPDDSVAPEALVVSHDQGSAFAHLAWDGTILARGIPSSAVDPWVSGNGLLPDVLGPALDLDATLSATLLNGSAGHVAGELRSQNANLQLEGDLTEGLRLVSEDESLSLSFVLDSVSSPRLVGPLVPFLVGVESAEEDGRALLSLSGFSLPLDGDLQGLSGKVTLEFGEVRYGFIPDLARKLPGVELLETRARDLSPLELEIVNGIVQYEPFNVSIGDVEVPLTGSVNLIRGSLDLEGELPLSVFGGEVGRFLEKQNALGALSKIPFHLGGTRESVEVSVEDVETLLKDLTDGKSVGNLLRGLLGDD